MKKTIFLLIVTVLIVLTIAGCQQECNHDYQREITLEATCTQTGVETFICTQCNYSYTQPLVMLEHTYDEGVVEKEATCAEEGVSKVACINCGDTQQMPIEKLPHTLGEATVTKESNCSEEGEYTAVCMVCNVSEVVEKIPMSDVHSFENKMIREATCSDLGEGIDTCTLCGYTQTCQYAYKEHAFNQSETVTAATCTTDGKKKVICSACGTTEERNISALGHKWAGATCAQAAKCTVCGASGSKASHNYEIIYQSRDQSTKYYAKQVDKQCKTCGEKKTLYYADKYELDLDKIQKELEDYARSYGFSVTNSFDDVSDSSKIKRVSFEVFKLPWYGGLDHLVQQAKNSIDYEYKQVKDFSTPISRQLLHLVVDYGEGASLGCGLFQVRLIRTSTT